MKLNVLVICWQTTCWTRRTVSAVCYMHKWMYRLRNLDFVLMKLNWTCLDHIAPHCARPTYGGIMKNPVFRDCKWFYHDALRLLLKKPRWSSASELFVSAGVRMLKAVLKCFILMFICWLNKTENGVVLKLTNAGYSFK